MQPKQDRHNEAFTQRTTSLGIFAHTEKGGSTDLLWRLSGLRHLLLFDAHALTHTHTITLQRYTYVSLSIQDLSHNTSQGTDFISKLQRQRE